MTNLKGRSSMRHTWKWNIQNANLNDAFDELVPSATYASLIYV